MTRTEGGPCATGSTIGLWIGERKLVVCTRQNVRDTFSFLFRSLANEEVNQMHGKVEENLLERLAVEIR